MSVLKLTVDNFEEEIKRYEGTAIVDFYADWCGPCKMMAPTIDKIAEELHEQVKIGKVNVDENLALAEQYEIMSIPTIMIFKGGTVTKVFNGVTDKELIISAVK